VNGLWPIDDGNRRTIVFFPEGAFGPTNNCVGIGDVLRSRGHRVVFVIEQSFAGTLEAKGFEERLMRLGPAPEAPEEPGQFWKDFIRDTAPVFRQEHARAARDVHCADMAGAARRRALRRRATRRDLRRDRAGCST
jgi:UDP:flavonoid glycosyltransferase YjiC (YdhE family)